MHILTKQTTFACYTTVTQAKHIPIHAWSLGSVLHILVHKTKTDQANRRQEKPENKSEAEAEASHF